ncbi:MAG: plasmid mobilization relaxosome protein MobC [Clostridia bacterium]|nr:plasmid mobilization relaxosome protein MobC [Clostridia bacterium]
MREKNQILHFRVSPMELERIRTKMEEIEVRNMGAYLRKMALDGYCVNLDVEDIGKIVPLLRRCSNNLNQYAKRANETGNIYAADIQDLQKRLDEIWMEMREILVRLSSIQ